MLSKNAQLIKKAMENPDFLAKLKANPKPMIEKATGIKFPDGMDVKVLQNSVKKFHLILPLPLDSLNEQELEAVQGGFLRRIRRAARSAGRGVKRAARRTVGSSRFRSGFARGFAVGITDPVRGLTFAATRRDPGRQGL